MMPSNRRRWLIYCLIGFWMAAAGPTRAADPPASPAPPARSAETAGEESPPSQVENAPTDPAGPAVKPPSSKKKAPRARKPFRPSEEIHVDKAVDFPADI
ncbi:MAG: hypothetical protein QNI89_10605 [Desulfobacterales bacterium]|nr:hypothetical protein [Desulfobacterales bacterium]